MRFPERFEASFRVADPTGTVMRRKSAWPRKHCFVRTNILDGRILQLDLQSADVSSGPVAGSFPPRSKAKRGNVRRCFRTVSGGCSMSRLNKVEGVKLGNGNKFWSNRGIAF